jgi:hypothetical protein
MTSGKEQQCIRALKTEPRLLKNEARTRNDSFGRSATRRKYTAEEKIHIVLEGFVARSQSMSCVAEGIKSNNFYS